MFNVGFKVRLPPRKLSASVASAVHQNDLSCVKFTVNAEKSNWQLTQIGEWLGFVVKTIMLFQVPQKK
mgnify:CR=1 FL=1